MKKIYTFIEFERKLKKNGFVFYRQPNGSHVIYSRGNEIVSIPRSQTINKMMARRMIKEFNLK